MVIKEMLDKKITCIIRGTYIDDAMLVKSCDNVYILNNKESGARPRDVKGYIYGYYLGTLASLNRHGLPNNIKLKHPLHIIHELW